MEKARGVLLEKMLPQMDTKKRWKLVKAVAEYQIKMAETNFSRYGSLYFTSDLLETNSSDGITSESSPSKLNKYSVGPTTGTYQRYANPLTLNVDFGPCESRYCSKSNHV